jgi:hypothetical protein
VEPGKYAFSDLILQAKSGSDIFVRSPHPVYRRYVDAAELMDVAMRLGLAGRSTVFDSGGTYVEIGDLASLMLTEVGQPGMRVRREARVDEPDDDYTADDSLFLELAADTGVSITDLRGQILRTARGIGSASHEADGHQSQAQA